MATIIGGIAASHTPTIAFAHDADKRTDPVWAPIFEAFKPTSQWLQDQKPDALIVIYNDHISSFFLDHYSAFALGVGERWEVADEGGGVRELPALNGHPELAAHIGHSLTGDDFDMSFFQGKPLDHGCFSPLSVLLPHESGWPVPVIPLQVGVLQFPVPSARRCYSLGKALRRAIESYPEPLRVAIIATGGLSHQVHGERCGFNNSAWDHQFLELLEKDPERLADLTQAEYAELGGMEGAEVIMWLIMRGALSASVVKRHSAYCLPSMTGICTAVFENQASPPVAGEIQRQRDHTALQTRGVEKLEGTYPYTLQRSIKALRINRFLHDMTKPAHRDAFRENEEALYEQHQLIEAERRLLRQRDWRGLIHYGAIFFVLEKWAAVLGVSNLHIYAAMRGQSLDDFLKTRNAPGALYSVAAVKQSQPVAFEPH
ncbi:MAG: gallate dioxygenase [Hydrogenophaga sp.]|uniref:gallate dioxygenase n=1 Tax=Hydrogenophaga sp. TaxID=1904254 RepID=UPI002AB90053|nr:gallate dioxygenase [Hydrogenophaga sp.]MDZ4187590.1 gallate dioxygenase [Hydrogenophaga sp.]